MQWKFLRAHIVLISHTRLQVCQALRSYTWRCWATRPSHQRQRCPGWILIGALLPGEAKQTLLTLASAAIFQPSPDPAAGCLWTPPENTSNWPARGCLMAMQGGVSRGRAWSWRRQLSMLVCQSLTGACKRTLHHWDKRPCERHWMRCICLASMQGIAVTACPAFIVYKAAASAGLNTDRDSFHMQPAHLQADMTCPSFLMHRGKQAMLKWGTDRKSSLTISSHP